MIFSTSTSDPSFSPKAGDVHRQRTSATWANDGPKAVFPIAIVVWKIWALNDSSFSGLDCFKCTASCCDGRDTRNESGSGYAFRKPWVWRTTLRSIRGHYTHTIHNTKGVARILAMGIYSHDFMWGYFKRYAIDSCIFVVSKTWWKRITRVFTGVHVEAWDDKKHSPWFKVIMRTILTGCVSYARIHSRQLGADLSKVRFVCVCPYSKWGL